MFGACLIQLIYLVSCMSVCLYADSRTNSSDCEDWSIRLQDGANVREGRVEICFNRAWGTICSDGFTEVDAGVVCTEMGYEREG